jgi:hypothetical protein
MGLLITCYWYSDMYLAKQQTDGLRSRSLEAWR